MSCGTPPTLARARVILPGNTNGCPRRHCLVARMCKERMCKERNKRRRVSQIKELNDPEKRKRQFDFFDPINLGQKNPTLTFLDGPMPPLCTSGRACRDPNSRRSTNLWWHRRYRRGTTRVCHRCNTNLLGIPIVNFDSWRGWVPRTRCSSPPTRAW